MSARALASASRPPRALIFPLSFELSERPKISPPTPSAAETTTARARTRARRTATCAPARDAREACHASRAPSSSPSSRAPRRRRRGSSPVAMSIDPRNASTANDPGPRRRWPRPGARARGTLTPPAGVAALLRARPALRAKLDELLRGRARVRVVRRETRVDSNAERAHAEEGSGAATTVSSENVGISKRQRAIAERAGGG